MLQTQTFQKASWTFELIVKIRIYLANQDKNAQPGRCAVGAASVSQFYKICIWLRQWQVDIVGYCNCQYSSEPPSLWHQYYSVSQAEADSCQLAPVTAALSLGDKFVGAENVARLVPATARVARWALISKCVYEMKVLGWKSISILGKNPWSGAKIASG